MTGSVRIRGAGVVCALGVGMTAVAASIAAGGEFAGFAGPSGARAAYPAPFDAQRDLPRGLGRRLGRQLAMSLAAVLEAVGPGQAWSETPEDTGIVGATAHGPIDETVDFVAGARRNGAKYASPLLFSTALHGSMAGLAARELGVRGPSIVVSSGDVSFETALLVAASGLASGRMKRAVVVGADGYHALYARAIEAFGLLCTSAEPIDPAMERATHGLHLGEGAGALLLEWDENSSDGVRLEDVHVGADVRRREGSEARVQLMTSGDLTSARRHSGALVSSRVRGGEIEHPAARFGAFSTLSAVAIAVEAGRRRRAAHDGSSTLFLAAPHGANTASVVLAGHGAG